jgi:hypothetical protein
LLSLLVISPPSFSSEMRQTLLLAPHSMITYRRHCHYNHHCHSVSLVQLLLL